MEGIRMVAIVPAKGKELASFTALLFEQLRAVKEESGVALALEVKKVCKVRPDYLSFGESAFEITGSYQVPGDSMHTCGLLFSKLSKEMELPEIRVDFFKTEYDLLK